MSSEPRPRLPSYDLSTTQYKTFFITCLFKSYSPVSPLSLIHYLGFPIQSFLPRFSHSDCQTCLSHQKTLEINERDITQNRPKPRLRIAENSLFFHLLDIRPVVQLLLSTSIVATSLMSNVTSGSLPNNVTSRSSVSIPT